MSIYQRAYFLLSAAEVKQLPSDEGYEVAIVGRSNSGKSSVLNALTHQKKLARISKTPGRTQQINIFILDEKRRIADLPGYGYAKAPLSAQKKWEKTVNNYFEHRQSLQGLLLIMDCRHPLKPLDLVMIKLGSRLKLPIHILLNKSDKLSKDALQKTLFKVKAALTQFNISVTVQGFSARNGTGLKALSEILDVWFHV